MHFARTKLKRGLNIQKTGMDASSGLAQSKRVLSVRYWYIANVPIRCERNRSDEKLKQLGPMVRIIKKSQRYFAVSILLLAASIALSQEVQTGKSQQLVRPLQMLVLGDSILWGQGLRTDKDLALCEGLARAEHWATSSRKNRSSLRRSDRTELTHRQPHFAQC